MSYHIISSHIISLHNLVHGFSEGLQSRTNSPQIILASWWSRRLSTRSLPVVNPPVVWQHGWNSQQAGGVWKIIMSCNLWWQWQEYYVFFLLYICIYDTPQRSTCFVLFSIYIYTYNSTVRLTNKSKECNKKEYRGPPPSIDKNQRTSPKLTTNHRIFRGFSIYLELPRCRVTQHPTWKFSRTPDGPWFRCWLCFCRWQCWGHRQARIQPTKLSVIFWGHTQTWHLSL